MSWIAPRASAGFALWAGVDLLDLPLSFELDLRSTWSLTSAGVPLPYQPHFAVRSSYVSGVFAGCWRLPVSLCPILEVGSMSFSEDDPPGRALGHSTVVAAGLRGVYERHLTERFFFRALVEFEGLPKPASLSSDAGPPTDARPPALSPRWLSLSGG